MSNRKAFFPQARSEDLIVTELDDEILIYDKNCDKAHCLNSTAARVWKFANGKRTVAEIAARMEIDLRTPVDERVVWYALDQLEKDHLLRENAALPNSRVGLTRREFIGAMGKGALLIAVPQVVSLNAPVPASSASCVQDGQCLPDGGNAQTDCCSGRGDVDQNCSSGFRCGSPLAPVRK